MCLLFLDCATVIVLAEVGTELPFDVKDQRTLFYTNDMKGANDLSDQLEKMVEEAIKDNKPDNPVYNAAGSKIIKDLEAKHSINEIVIREIDDIKSMISTMNSFLLNKNSLSSDGVQGSRRYRVRIKDRSINVTPKDIIEKLKSIATIDSSSYRVLNGGYEITVETTIPIKVAIYRILKNLGISEEKVAIYRF